MKRIVFEAHAILKWTQKEPGYEKVKSLMFACREGSFSGYMNRINLGEVHYKTIRVLRLEGAKDFMENLVRLPITIALPDDALTARGLDVLTTQNAGNLGLNDTCQLLFASENRRTLLSYLTTRVILP